MAEFETKVIRDLVAEALHAKLCGCKVTPMFASCSAWRACPELADAVLGLFNVSRESFGDVTTRVVLTLAPAVPEVDRG